jgi:hypothetical protein
MPAKSAQSAAIALTLQAARAIELLSMPPRFLGVPGSGRLNGENVRLARTNPRRSALAPAPDFRIARAGFPG